jgi:hypothetical protein
VVAIWRNWALYFKSWWMEKFLNRSMRIIHYTEYIPAQETVTLSLIGFGLTIDKTEEKNIQE